MYFFLEISTIIDYKTPNIKIHKSTEGLRERKRKKM